MNPILARFVKVRPWLYHTTADENLKSICSEGALHCAATLRANLPLKRRDRGMVIERGAHLVTLRDQQPLQRGHTELLGGWSWEDLLQALNGRVFFWPGNDDGPIASGRRLMGAYSGEAVLRMSTQEMFSANQSPDFCRFNSGGPRTTGGRKSPRGPDTFLPADAWKGVPSDVVEVSFVGSVKLPRTTQQLAQNGAWRNLWRG